MTDVAYTEFWVASAAAAPVLLIPVYLLVREESESGSKAQSGVGVASVGFLAAATILALVQLSGGSPVRGNQFGRIIEVLLIALPIVALAVALMRSSGRRSRGL